MLSENIISDVIYIGKCNLESSTLGALCQPSRGLEVRASFHGVFIGCLGILAKDSMLSAERQTSSYIRYTMA